jgi:hypothetical protein
VEGQAFFTGTLHRKRNKEQKLPQSRLCRVSDDGRSEKAAAQNMRNGFSQIR